MTVKVSTHLPQLNITSERIYIKKNPKRTTLFLEFGKKHVFFFSYLAFSQQTLINRYTHVIIQTKQKHGQISTLETDMCLRESSKEGIIFMFTV